MTATTYASDTRTVLPWLEAQQRRIQGILAGLDDDALRQVVLPSGWSCAGMIQHLTVMTRFWFVEVMAGLPSREPESDDFHVSATTPVSTLLDTYEREAEAAIAKSAIFVQTRRRRGGPMACSGTRAWTTFTRW